MFFVLYRKEVFNNFKNKEDIGVLITICQMWM